MYPHLFNIVRKKHVTVASVIGMTQPNVDFRPVLIAHPRDAWQEIVNKMANGEHSEEHDTFGPDLHATRNFSVHSVFSALMDTPVHFRSKYLCHLKQRLKSKVPLVPNIPMQRDGYSKDNLTEHKCQGDTHCSFCFEQQIIRHLFNCAIARVS